MRAILGLLVLAGAAALVYFMVLKPADVATVMVDEPVADEAAVDVAIETSDAEPEDMTPRASGTDDDPNIWLEEVLGADALAWVRSHNEATLADLKSDARYEDFYAEALEVYTSQDRIVAGEPRDGFLYNFWQDDTHVRGIWRRSPLGAYLAGTPDWDVILDLDVLAAEEDENWVWDFADCLAGSTRCLIALSHGGSDANFFREFDMETRSFVEGGFALGESKQGMEWLNEDTAVVATDRGEGTMTTSGYPNTAVLLRRGEALEDATEIFAGELSDVGMFGSDFDTPEGHTNILVRAISFFEYEYFHVAVDGTLTPLAAPRRSDIQGIHRGQLILGLNEDWTIDTPSGEQTYSSGSVVSYSLNDYLDNYLTTGQVHTMHTVFVPEDRVAFENAAPSGGALYLSILDNVVGQVLRATFDNGWSTEAVDLPSNGTVGIAATDDMEDRIFFTYENFVTPDSLYYSVDGSAPNQVQSLPEWFDATGLTVSQQIAISSDGERIPYFLIHGDDIEYDGSTPTLVYGYGGFQISELPFYSGTVGRLWLANGGAYALTNIRGGGEFGPSWHQAALLENRQLAFDDFIAVQEHLIETGVTTPRRMGIMGGSNGGLLVGVSMVQRPDLINAVVCQVPLLDMLRYHMLLAGASWMGEYGNPDIPEQRAYIEEYSPYQLLDPDADYPTAFFYTSTRDDRVHPGHARKMVARMIEQDHDVQYFERIEGGHSGGANLAQSAERVALEYVYLARQLVD